MDNLLYYLYIADVLIIAKFSSKNLKIYINILTKLGDMLFINFDNKKILSHLKIGYV